MPRYTKPRKTWMYSPDFKVKAVRLSEQEGIYVKQVADALDIHPFMLSRWRKECREGKLLTDKQRRVSVTTKKKVPSKAGLTEVDRLKKENAKLKEEKTSLKSGNGILRNNIRPIWIHPKMPTLRHYQVV